MKNDYEIYRICTNCDSRETTTRSKRDAAFGIGNYPFAGVCKVCGSNKFEWGFTLPEYDEAIFDEWRKSESLRLLDQDEELMIAEVEYLPFLKKIIDEPDSKESKRLIATEALCILAYDNLPDPEEPANAETLQLALEALRARPEAVKAAESYLWPYIRDEVYPTLDI